MKGIEVAVCRSDATSNGSGIGSDRCCCSAAAEWHGVETTEDPQGDNRRVRTADVTRLPFMAGVALAISGVITFVQGLYTLTSWWGWFFIALGILVGVTGLMLIFSVAGARLAAAVAALVSLAFAALRAPVHVWYSLSIIGFDVLAIYAIAKWHL